MQINSFDQKKKNNPQNGKNGLIWVEIYYFVEPFWPIFFKRLIGSPDLSGKGTYKFTLVRASVRASVRPYVRSGPTALTVHYFFLIFCMKLGFHMT